ncbi:MAG: hypothetical protein KIT56_05720 [Gammaproteobacteria bacterium]|nr:hypothetical protein [Gammaproteobacteria bacterium]MCW5583367.1 hypothetical protein [Gammaproteobacteria bacterium]
MNTNQTLSQLLQYKNQSVFNRYRKDYPNNKMLPEEAFCELVKYLWLCHQHKIDQDIRDDSTLNFTCVMHAEMHELDHMWHTFLLFTKDYQDFCMRYFGEFFHHCPLSDTDINLSTEIYSTELKNYLSYIYDKLGEDTLRKWFGECL